MYIWAVVLLSALAAISSYTLHVFPFSLLFAVALAIVTEVCITKFYLKRKLSIPFSAIITGLIIGSIALQSSSFLLIAVAVIIGILSKFFIKIKSVNVFNPAAIGLLVALTVFASGDVWWAASNYTIYGLTFSLVPILIIAAYNARRLTTSFSFIVVFFLISIAIGHIHQFSVNALDTLLFSTNYYFAFVMLAEPRTSPIKSVAQAAYGSSMAVVYAAFAFYGVPHPFLVALLVGNVAYAIYRSR